MARVDPRNLVEVLIDPLTGDVVEARIPGFRHWGRADVARVVLLKDPDLRVELNRARADGENLVSSTLQSEPFRPYPYAEHLELVNDDGQRETRIAKASRVRIDLATLHPSHLDRLGKTVRHREHPIVLRRDLQDDANDDVRPIKEDEIDVLIDAPTEGRISRDTTNVHANVSRSTRPEVTGDPEGVNDIRETAGARRATNGRG